MNKQLITSDCHRYYGSSDIKTRIKTHIFQASYRYTKELRTVHSYMETGSKSPAYFYHRLRLLSMSNKYGFQVGPTASIGEGLYLGHRGTIIVNGQAILGKNINIMPGVTIGQENRGKRQGVPTLGNEIWIGTNAVIVGNITIGDDVLIAPNAYVNFDVPAHSVVVGNPARIIYRENATEGYIQNKV